MRDIRKILPLFVVAALSGFVGGLVLPAFPTLAARNSSGTYTLPAGNPVVTGTTISSSWANTTLSDLGAEVTNSFDRNGRGCMLASAPMASGTVSAPGLNFCLDTNTGLYRIGSHDIGFAVNGVKSEEWTTTGASDFQGRTITQSQAGLAGLSVTGGSVSGNGVTANGVGSGNGVNGYGGSSGLGVQGNAAANSGSDGVQGSGGSGTGTGYGVTGYGGANGGVGVRGVGGTNGGGGTFTATTTGIGVVGNGAGAGAGGSFTGGASGLGVYGIGGGPAISGGQFSNGTPQSATVAQDALQAQNGNLGFTSVTQLNSNVGLQNRIGALNAPKVWATLDCNNGTLSVVDGFNITGITAIDTNNVRLTFASAFSGTGYAPIITYNSQLSGAATIPGPKAVCSPYNKTATTVDIACWNQVGNAVLNLNTVSLNSLTVVIFGRQ